MSLLLSSFSPLSFVLLLLDSVTVPPLYFFGLIVLSYALCLPSSAPSPAPALLPHSHILFSLWPALVLLIAYSPSQYWGDGGQ